MPSARTKSKTNPRLATVRKLVPLFLDWFAHNARDLPWRHTRDPYAIWVSEIMLQQTQVKTVIPYWERWMRELPTIEALAKASSEKIHKLWEGLGYYTRVRNMQKAAQQIVGRHQLADEGAGAPRFPENFDDVLALPGIGRYTAGAICSIAFNQPTPILDGNVIRVLTRLFAISRNPREKKTNAHLWNLAEVLVLHASRFKFHASRPPHPASALNQSLMELGALICTPRSPKCADCPVQKLCAALRLDRVEQLPNPGKRTAATERRFAAFVLECEGRFLVRQRPAGVVNAHLWEFPNIELNGAPDLAQAANSALGFVPGNFRVLCTIRHSITRYRITLEAHLVEGTRASHRAAQNTRWLTLRELKFLSFPSAHRKILDCLGKTVPAPNRGASQSAGQARGVHAASASQAETPENIKPCGVFSLKRPEGRAPATKQPAV